ncbi:hypothetical protein MTO96_026860 [Rhipicephalus appendiculatus]
MRSTTERQRPFVDLDSCWCVPVAAACITFLSCIASSSYGFLYVLFMQKHELSREQAAWPQTSLVISGGCMGLLVSVVQKKFSIYHITLAGGIVASAGLAGASFAPNIVWLSITFGVLQGTNADGKNSSVYCSVLAAQKQERLVRCTKRVHPKEEMSFLCEEIVS